MVTRRGEGPLFLSLPVYVRVALDPRPLHGWQTKPLAAGGARISLALKAREFPSTMR